MKGYKGFDNNLKCCARQEPVRQVNDIEEVPFQ